MKKTILFAILLCIITILPAQMNEIQILLNQARVHENRNQLSQALEIYETLYQQHPRNEDVVDAYLRVLFLRANFETARQVINNGKNVLPAVFIAKQEVNYLVKTNEIEAAERFAIDWLNRNPTNANVFSEFARVFEISTLFDTSIKIYEQGRTKLNNTNLFILELSNAYYYVRNHQKFFEESIKFLRTNPGYLYFYRTRFKEFLAQNPEYINDIEEFIYASEPTDQLLELFAFSLVEIQDFQRAADIFEILPLQNMVRFADDLRTDGHLDFALDTYNRALLRTTTPVELADIQYKIAEIYFEKNDMENSILVLMEIIENGELHESPWRNRTRANTQSRLLMALISMQSEEQDNSVTVQWFESATTFANNQTERAEIQFRQARFLYLNEDYQPAFRVIDQAVQGQRPNTSIYKMSFFPRYEIALFQGSAERDSLLTECIINFPEDPRITEMLYLETFVNSLDNNSKPMFLQALRYKGLYKDKLASETMIELAENTGIEELYIFAYEWALLAGITEIIELVQKKDFTNHVLRDFVFLHTLRRNSDFDERRNMISNFLNNNPQNVFSPQLRGML